MKNSFRMVLIVACSMILISCLAQVPYKSISEQSTESVPAGKSQIVFVRFSSKMSGSKVPAVLFELSDEKEILISPIPNESKVTYNVEPGKHLFMVHSTEAADFLEADILPNRIYYVMVRPFPGAIFWRFSFAPFRKSGDSEFIIGSDNFMKWVAQSINVEKSEETLDWHNKKHVDVSNKRKKYLPKWKSKSLKQRNSQTLSSDDGILIGK